MTTYDFGTLNVPKLISRKIQTGIKLTITQCGKTRNSPSPKNISSNQLFSNLSSKTVNFTKFLPKMRGGRILVISTLCIKIFWEFERPKLISRKIKNGLKVVVLETLNWSKLISRKNENGLKLSNNYVWDFELVKIDFT